MFKIFYTNFFYGSSNLLRPWFQYESTHLDFTRNLIDIRAIKMHCFYSAFLLFFSANDNSLCRVFAWILVLT